MGRAKVKRRKGKFNATKCKQRLHYAGYSESVVATYCRPASKVRSRIEIHRNGLTSYPLTAAERKATLARRAKALKRHVYGNTP
jgi:hypothetical protein